MGMQPFEDPFTRWVRLLNLVPPSDADLGGFIVAGVWKSLGVSHERLERPYSDGHSVFRLTEVAMDCGAWRCRPNSHMPLPGDVAVLSDGSPEGAHAFVVTQVRPGDPLLVKSVEGSVNGVHSRVRSWRGTTDLSDGRFVLGWIDVASLPIQSAFQS